MVEIIISTFEGKKIRRHWDEKQEKWYFSVVDVISALTESTNPTDYLKKLRKRDPELGNYIGTNCPQVKMAAVDELPKMPDWNWNRKQGRRLSAGQTIFRRDGKN